MSLIYQNIIDASFACFFAIATKYAISSISLSLSFSLLRREQ